jgi:hypothetical protein
LRVGRLVAVLAAGVSISLATGMLVSTGGCSGASDMQGPAGRDEEGQKLLQERMKENMAKKGVLKGQKK